jgi:hypothetical protein
MAFETMESAMTVALYAALGNAVTYTAQDAEAASIYAIVSDTSIDIGQDSQMSEDLTFARIKISDVATPRRGDRIETAAGKVLVVDAVRRENNVEWSLTLTERDR